MAKVVESKLLDPGPPTGARKGPPELADPLPVPAKEYVRGPEPVFLAKGLEKVGQVVGHRDLPPLPGLGFGEVDIPGANSLPFELKDLTPPHPGMEGGEDHRAEVGRTLVQELGRFVLGQEAEPSRGLLVEKSPGGGEGGFLHHLPLDRLREKVADGGELAIDRGLGSLPPRAPSASPACRCGIARAGIGPFLTIRGRLRR